MAEIIYFSKGKKINLIKLSKHKVNQKIKKRRASSLDEMGEFKFTLVIFFFEISKKLI